MLTQAFISDYYRKLEEAVRSQVMRETEAQIVGTDVDTLAKFIYDTYALAEIVTDTQRQPSWEPQDYLRTVSAEQRGPLYGADGDLRDYSCQRVVVEVPIMPNPHLHILSKLNGAQFSFSYADSDFKWGPDVISTYFVTKDYGFQMDDGQIPQNVENRLQAIKNLLNWKNQSVAEGNKQLLNKTKHLIQQRRAEIEKNKQKIADLTKTISISLKQKPPSGITAVRISHSAIVQRVRPKPSLPEEYVLDESKVKDVISLLDNQSRSFEQTPSAFKTLNEEQLRDIFLSGLNSVFEGNATGETFSKNGKTDIHLKIAKGNILICECKIWGGKALYSKTLDQLRGYLTWRNNYGIIISFVHSKNFTQILEEASAGIQKHASYLNGFTKEGATRLVSNHCVDDELKQVKIYHLFYHLYSK